jgi:aspartyl aminopeptidase
LAGKVILYDQEKGKVVSRLLNLKRPICKVSNLAIHLQTANERGKLDLNNE